MKRGNTHTRMYAFTYMCARTQARTQAHTHTHKQTHTNRHTHTHTSREPATEALVRMTVRLIKPSAFCGFGRTPSCRNRAHSPQIKHAHARTHTYTHTHACTHTHQACQGAQFPNVSAPSASLSNVFCSERPGRSLGRVFFK